MAPLTEYEIQRNRNIERNKAILESLELEGTNSFFPIKPKPAATSREKSVKRTDNGDSDRPHKIARNNHVAEPKVASDCEVRRSARNVGKSVDYSALDQDRSARGYRVATRVLTEMGSDARDANKRTQDPKKYGHILGIEVSTWWETRQACSTDAIHAPWVGGISCGPKGAYSVALSGGYDDDVDMGTAFTYTGSGGRDLTGTKDKPKNLRTAPQSSDQTFENHFNKALKLSSETKMPVRVIRGFKLNSKFAPAEGYRYDGLYRVEKAWQEVGLSSKYMVCKYAFKRLSGQPPIPERAESQSLTDASHDVDTEDVDEEGVTDDAGACD